MKLDDATWDKWTNWTSEIRADLSRTINDRAIFRAFFSVVEENEEWISVHHGRRFCRFVFRGYAASAALGIRRHLKTNSDSISLARLLEQIQKCASQITIQYYMNKFPLDSQYVDWQSATFGTLSNDGTVVSPEIVEQDLLGLRQLTNTIENFADRVLAHLDCRGFQDKVSFTAINTAIEQFDKLVCRYNAFLGGDGYTTLEAVVQYPWEQIFDIPMKKPL